MRFDLLGKTRQALRKSRQGFFGRVLEILERPRLDEGLWGELEELLISADVGVPATELLLRRVKEQLGRGEPKEGSQVRRALQEEMVGLLGDTQPPFSSAIPWVILVVGVNGSGKTTCIAKLAHRLKGEGKQVILAAADTFRAGAIEQLKEWAERVGADVIAHQPGADPGAVVFDALEAARSRGAHAVIIDTAGRLHTKYNLMEELKKIKRVAARSLEGTPHQVLLVLDATTGQNGLAQARYFAQAVEVNGIFLAKLDGTAKGGIVLAIAQELKLPILFIGTGEGVEDLAPFDAQAFVEALLQP